MIYAIAEGRSQNNQVATAVGIQTSEPEYYLKELRGIGIVAREMLVVSGSRRAVYRLSDNLFRFWHRFVLPNRTAIEHGLQRRVLRSVLEGLTSLGLIRIGRERVRSADSRTHVPMHACTGGPDALQ